MIRNSALQLPRGHTKRRTNGQYRRIPIGDINILALGAVGDELNFIPDSVKPKLRAFFVDAGHDLEPVAGGIRLTPLQEVVTAQGGNVTIKIRKQTECSSVPDVNMDIIKAFGLQEYVEIISKIDKEATTVEAIAKRYNVSFDYIKTDIEGQDGPVIMASKALLETALVVKMELRFLPYYEGEPFFDEVVLFMRQSGFDVERVDVENWKYDTTDRDRIRLGRSVHADVIFVRSPNLIEKQPSSEEIFIRQILVLMMHSRISYCQFILENYLKNINSRLRSDLEIFIKNIIEQDNPISHQKKLSLWRRLTDPIVRMAKAIVNSPGGAPVPAAFPFLHVEKRS